MFGGVEFNLVIVSSGAGGGTLAYRLAPTGRRVLIVERGGYVTREKENSNPKLVNVEGRNQTKEQWKNRDGKDLHPHTSYYLGGNTDLYEAALFRQCFRATFGDKLVGPTSI